MPSRILIVRLGSLGDLVHTLPAAAALRATFPGATIDWLVDAPHREFLSLVPVVSSLIVVRDRSAGAWWQARRELRARRYDVALDFQGLIKSAVLARLSGAPVHGFERQALRERAAAWCYARQVPVPAGAHVIQKNLALAADLGARAERLTFPIAPVDTPVVTAFLAQVTGPYALLNPGAAWPNKRWPPERLGAVARALRDQHGIASIVLWGPGEQDAARVAVGQSDGAARLAPETGLRDLLALARGARLMVSGDTGPLHITSALGVPAVALFGPTDPARNGPLDPEDVSLSRYDRCACHYERTCRQPQSWCLATIDVDAVNAAVATRLGRAARARASAQVGQ